MFFLGLGSGPDFGDDLTVKKKNVFPDTFGFRTYRTRHTTCLLLYVHRCRGRGGPVGRPSQRRFINLFLYKTINTWL